MTVSKHIQPLPSPNRAAMQAYGVGFLFATALTIAAFVLVWAYTTSDGAIYSRGLLIFMLAVLAVLQLLVQVIFFLHLSAERRARLTLISAIFTVVVTLMIVVGSLWIMQNLNYNMMPSDVNQYVQQEENIHEE